MKIGIVGLEESKWKSKGQIRRAKERIEGILRRHATKEALHENPDVNPIFAIESGCKLIILVSGHCTNGGVDIWAEEIADKLGIQKEIYSPTGICECGNELPLLEQCYFRGEENVKGFVCEGVGNMERYYASNRKRGEPHAYTVIWKVGWDEFKRRNIKIAKVCDILYCVVPKTCIPTKEELRYGILADYPSDVYCWHHNDDLEGLGHPRNGGCWTMKYAKSLGRETHLVIID